MSETLPSYVPTRAVQAAVKGRESEILDALGVDWRKGRPHIQCPYPSHADNDPSWRFTPSRGRAFCTCIEGSDSILDVSMKIRECDFEAAKVFVAETLGRRDLIRQPDPAKRRHPRSDARSLMSPPADQRDDGLARTYLAHRLDIEAVEVPMPTTSVVGWKGLAYIEAPPRASKR